MERRSFVRVPLDMPLFARMEAAGRPPCSGMVVDLSRGGMQLVLPAPPEGNLLGAAVVIAGMPGDVDPTGAGCAGTVCWVTSTRCGVRFTHLLPLSDAQLDALSV